MSISKAMRVGFIVIVFAFGVITAAVGFIHFDPMCGEELGVEKTSPDGLYVAQLMTRNCGATTAYVSHVNLRLAKSKFHRDFWSGAIYKGEVFTSSKYSGDRFCWSSPHKLSIGYPGLIVRNWHDVAIDADYGNPQCQ
jgi:hypothetical protein